MADDRAGRPASRRWRLALGAMVLLGAILRVVVRRALAAHDPSPLTPGLDGTVFLDWAARIAAGEGAGEGAWFFNPLYAWFLAPFVAIFGPRPLEAVWLGQALLGLATIVLVADAARRLLGERVALPAAALATTWPLLLFYEPLILGVTTGVFLNALALWMLAWFAGRRSGPAAFAAGIPLGLAVLARPNILPFGPLLAPWMATLAPQGDRRRFALHRTAMLLGGMALCLLPSLVRNMVVLGRPVLTTTSAGINLFLCNNPSAREAGTMHPHEITFTPFTLEAVSTETAERAEGHRLDPVEVSAYWRGRALDAVVAAPGPSAVFLLRKFLYFFGGEELPSSFYFEAWRDETPPLRFLPLSFALLAPFLVVGAWCSLRRREALPFTILVLVYAAGLTVFLPLDHYRAPVLPAAFVLASFGAVETWRALRGTGTSGRGAAAACIVAGLLLGFGNRVAGALGVESLGPARGDRVYFHVAKALALEERARAAQEDGRERDAREASDEAARRARLALEHAEPGSPDAWLAHRVLAETARVTGDVVSEERHMAAALRMHPGDAELLLRESRRLRRLGRDAEALAAVEEAIALDPHRPVLRAAATDILFALGRLDAALAHMEAAAADDPDTPSWLGNQALLLRRLGRPEEALQRLDAALRQRPTEPVWLLEKARALVETGDVNGAAEAARAAVDAGAMLPPELVPLLRR